MNSRRGNVIFILSIYKKQKWSMFESGYTCSTLVWLTSRRVRSTIRLRSKRLVDWRLKACKIHFFFKFYIIRGKNIRRNKKYYLQRTCSTGIFSESAVEVRIYLFNVANICELRTWNLRIRSTMRFSCWKSLEMKLVYYYYNTYPSENQFFEWKLTIPLMFSSLPSTLWTLKIW